MKITTELSNEQDDNFPFPSTHEEFSKLTDKQKEIVIRKLARGFGVDFGKIFTITN